MPDYARRKKIRTFSKIYEEIFESRGVESIQHYDVYKFSEKVIRSRYSVREHVWSKGDKLYKLANQYYGDIELWWIIALWNGKPTDAQYEFGTVVQIPFPPNEIRRKLIEEQ